MTSSEAHKTAVAELVGFFHGVKHNLSDISVYCGLNFVSKFYTDSSLAKMFIVVIQRPKALSRVF
jgi:hypothetical protein